MLFRSAKCGKVLRFNGRQLNKENLLGSQCDALFVRSTTRIDSKLLEGTNVRFVGTATSGIDNVDVDYIKEKNIFFANAPGSNSNSVAEYVLFSILKWSFQNKVELTGKTIGVVGYGNIGKIVARYAQYMGLKVLINDPPLKENRFPFPNYCKYNELNQLLSEADIITNHIPLTNDGFYPTYNLFNDQNIRLLKNNSLFIHASRGGVVCERALLNKFDISGITIVADVFENEPLVNKELVEKSLLATPHIAGYSFDGKIRGTKAMAFAFQKYYKIEPDMTVIDRLISEYIPLDEEKFRYYSFIYELLKNSRNLDDDFDGFLQTMKFDDITRAKSFDYLRKNYKKRREVL